MGFSCSISQVLLVREFMNIFCGNELILGVILANWLLIIAFGSGILGRLADTLGRRIDWLVLTLVLTSTVLPLQILFVRSMGGWFVAARGEMVGLLSTFYVTFLALLPFCSLHGFQFTLGCKLSLSGDDRSPIKMSRLYVLEAIGAVIGGLAFTYLLVHHLHVLEISIGLSLLNLFLALVLLKGGDSSNLPWRLLTAVIVMLLALDVYAVATGTLRVVDIASYQQQWGGLKLIHHENSIYGNIAITRSDGQRDFWVNSLPLFSAPDPDIAFIEEVVHIPMLQHPSPDSVLLIGEGLGGVLREILKHPVRRVVYVELDPLLIELAKKYSYETSVVLDDPRVEVVHADSRLFVKGSEDLFDVVIVNLPSPSTLQLNRLYTLEFFREAREILDENGIISTGITSSLTYVAEEMGARNRCIYDAIKMVFPSCLAVPGEYNIFLASPSTRADVLIYDASILHQRLLDRGVETSLLTEGYIKYKFSPEKIKMALAYLHRGGGEINRDTRPLAVYYDLALWNTMFHPHMRAIFTLMQRVDLWWFLLPLGLSTSALMMRRRTLRISHAPIYLTLFTTGLAGMTFSIITLYAFQVLCGYLYQELGAVAASFMLGLALGGWFMSRRISRLGGGVPALACVEGGIVAYSLLLPLAIEVFSIPAVKPIILPLVRTALPLLNCASGFLVGLGFPLASEICLRGGDRIGSVAGAVYASDLLGGCVGSLISGIWLISLHGIPGACFMVATLNAASLILLFGRIGAGQT